MGPHPQQGDMPMSASRNNLDVSLRPALASASIRRGGGTASPISAPPIAPGKFVDYSSGQVIGTRWMHSHFPFAGAEPGGSAADRARDRYRQERHPGSGRDVRGFLLRQPEAVFAELRKPKPAMAMDGGTPMTGGTTSMALGGSSTMALGRRHGKARPERRHLRCLSRQRPYLGFDPGDIRCPEGRHRTSPA